MCVVDNSRFNTGADMTCSVISLEEENWIVARDITTDITSQGKNTEEALENLKEALELFYEDESLREVQL